MSLIMSIMINLISWLSYNAGMFPHITCRAALLTGRYQTRSGIYPDVLGMASVGGEHDYHLVHLIWLLTELRL